MGKYLRLVLMFLFVGSAGLYAADSKEQGMMKMDCSGMSDAMKKFAETLTPHNKMMFCGKFNDAQRNLAMQMASQMDPNGQPVMTGDQAVEKVATDNNLLSPNSSGGCPVK